MWGSEAYTVYLRSGAQTQGPDGLGQDGQDPGFRTAALYRRTQRRAIDTEGVKV